MPLHFPDPRQASPHGIVAVGGTPDVENLLEAYRHGVFPWPIEDLPLTWFCPKRRAILQFDELHIPRSLDKSSRRLNLEFTIDRDFSHVIRTCASIPRGEEHGTWITEEMIKSYEEFHRLGYSHSVEAWKDGELVGGLYGVDADGAFSGESMFHTIPDASKLALVFLIEHLRSRGLEYIDLQMMTPHMKSLGARLIRRDEFLKRLAATRAKGLKLF